MTLELLGRLGALAAGGGLAVLVLARPPLARLGGLGLLAAGMAALVPLLVPDGQGRVVAAGAPVLLAAGGAIAFLLHRWPWALAFLALAAVPARVPVDVGDESASLLLPLYVVLGGAAAELAWRLWRGEEGARELGRASWPLALVVLWAGASALWAGDVTEAAVDLFFFVFPFALLALLVARLPWQDEAPLWLLRLLVAMALLFSAVGIAQWATKEVFWNEKVMRGNENSVLFRVNSLFWDPSIYGRFLVVAILSILVVITLARVRPPALPGVVVASVLWVGLLFSFSQSSFAALAAGLAVIVVLMWGSRGALGLGLLALVAVIALLLAPPFEGVRDELTGGGSKSLNRATRGRADLVVNGLRIAAEHPVVGVGVGNFTSAYAERFDVPGRVRTPASHTTPVTVLAETGVVGFGLFIWLVAAVLSLGYAAGRSEREPARLTGLVAFVGIVAILVHSLFYSGFVEDPMTWTLIGLAALAARRGVSMPRTGSGDATPASLADVRGPDPGGSVKASC
jgi:O-antigen ligase